MRQHVRSWRKPTPHGASVGQPSEPCLAKLIQHAAVGRVPPVLDLDPAPLPFCRRSGDRLAPHRTIEPVFHSEPMARRILQEHSDATPKKRPRRELARTAGPFFYLFGSTTETTAVEEPGAAKLATSSTIAFHSGVAAADLKTSGLSNHSSVTI